MQRYDPSSFPFAHLIIIDPNSRNMHPHRFLFDDWSPANRIRLVATFAVLTTIELAYRLGLTRGENLYQIIKGNHGITEDLAQRIATLYPIFSKHWLLTGEGDPLVAGFPEEEFFYEMKRNRKRPSRRMPAATEPAAVCSRKVPEALAEMLRQAGIERRIEGPIYGRWLMERLEDRQPDGKWLVVTDYDATDPKRRIYHEYFFDGIRREEHGAMKEAEERYAFDSHTGCLATQREILWVTLLTTSSLEAYHIDGEGIFRCIFRRAARK